MVSRSIPSFVGDASPRAVGGGAAGAVGLRSELGFGLKRTGAPELGRLPGAGDGAGDGEGGTE